MTTAGADHHVRIRYVVTCDRCGDIAEVGTISEGTSLAEEHEAADNEEVGQ